jgi:hypothetical protein
MQLLVVEGVAEAADVDAVVDDADVEGDVVDSVVVDVVLVVGGDCVVVDVADVVVGPVEVVIVESVVVFIEFEIVVEVVFAAVPVVAGNGVVSFDWAVFKPNTKTRHKRTNAKFLFISIDIQLKKSSLKT